MPHVIPKDSTSLQPDNNSTLAGLGGAVVVTPTPQSNTKTVQSPTQPSSNPILHLIGSIFGVTQTTINTSTQAAETTMINAAAGTAGQLVQTGFILPIAIELQNTLSIIFGPKSPLGFVWSTPLDMTVSNPDVQSVWFGMEGLSVTFLSIFLAWEFLKVMLKQSTIDYAEALEVLPKVIFAFVASLLSVAIVRALILLNNDICNALNKNIVITGFSTNNFSLLYEIAWFVYAAMWLLLAVQAVVRIVLICGCIAVGPLALLTFASKQTEAIGRLWVSTLTASVFVQTFQVLCVYIGIHWIVSAFSFSDRSTVVIGLLASIAVLYLAVELPRMFQNAALHAMHSASQSFNHVVSSSVKTVSNGVSSAVKAMI